MKAGARAWLMDQEEGKRVGQAVTLAAQLVTATAGTGSASHSKRMQ